MRFFKLDKKILELNLSPKALFVYAFMASRANALNYVVTGYGDIGSACNMTSKTVISAVSELCEVGLLIKRNRYNSKGYKKNGYYIAMVAKSRGWIALEYDIFKSGVGSTDFAVYLYIKSCMGRVAKSRKKIAFPSLTRISKGVNVSRSRVVQAVSYLRTHSFLNCIQRRYKATKAFFINCYTAITLKNAQKKHARQNVLLKKYFLNI